MAGTVKLCVPDAALVGELVACEELFGCAEAVAVPEESAAAERLCLGESDGVGDESGVPVSADVGDAPGTAPEATADGAAGGADPLAAHAVRPAPPMTAAMITAGTRHIIMMLLSSGE